MTKKVSITCDSCSQDIGTTQYAADYYLSLTNVRMPYAEGPIFAMQLQPSFNGDKHFCGTKCLKDWVAENIK